MDAAVSLHAGALPLAATLPPPPHLHHQVHHHRALPPRLRHAATAAAAAQPIKPPSPRLALAARPQSPVRSASASSPALAPARSSSHAATGYAAALADACAQAGTLRRAARNARNLLSRRRRRSAPEEEEEELDARVVALVRMLVGKGKAGMVPDVLAEFAHICDKLLPPSPPAPARARHAY